MEYNKIVVPLDGSNLAESVMPHVIKIAKGCAMPQVILVTVTEPVHVKTPRALRIEQLPGIHQGPILYYGGVTGAGREIVPDSIMDLPVTIGKMAKTGYNYLSKIAAKLEKEGIQVTIAVLIGDVATEITRFAKDEKADLIVMASGGKKTLKRWDVGNAAEKVSHTTDIPIFLVKPPAGFKETKPVRKGKPS
ncbi:MAG: universal stress protein [Dehalococcoidales bacterium]|jgi:nucleotide-binding universal stress UspA family protein